MSYTQHDAIIVTMDYGEAEEAIRKWVNNQPKGGSRFTWKSAGTYLSVILLWDNYIEDGDELGEKFIKFIRELDEPVHWIGVSYGELGRGWIGEAGRPEYKFADKESWQGLLVVGKIIKYVGDGNQQLSGMITRIIIRDGITYYIVKPNLAHRLDSVKQEQIYGVQGIMFDKDAR